MVSVALKRAVAAARQYVQTIVGAGQVHNLAVDEVEHDVKKQRWRIVLSFIMPLPKLPGHVLSYPLTVQRERRLLLVDAKTYQVVSMKRVTPPNE